LPTAAKSMHHIYLAIRITNFTISSQTNATSDFVSACLIRVLSFDATTKQHGKYCEFLFDIDFLWDLIKRVKWLNKMIILSVENLFQEYF